MEHLLLCLLLFFCTAAKQPVSFLDNQIFPAFCQKAAEEEACFATFRQEPLYNLFFENRSFEEGKADLAAIRAHDPDLLERIEEVRKNDALGSPRLFSYEGVGQISPTTLHYIRLAGELRRQFGSLEGKKIVEIGGGHGGLCAVLSTLFSPKSYTLVDLPSSLKLSQKYLGAVGIKNVRFASPDSLPEEEADLVVSHFSFGELDRSIQRRYIDNILLRAQRGYLLCAPPHWKEIPYSTTAHKRVKPLPKEKLLHLLNNKETKCIPKNKNNFIIIWNNYKFTKPPPKRSSSPSPRHTAPSTKPPTPTSPAS